MSMEERLISLRKGRGMSQLEAAEALGVSRQAVSKWESGAAVPSIDNLRAISRLYEVTIDHLVGNEDASPVLSPGPDASAEPEFPHAPAGPKGTDGKRTRELVLCLICLLVAVILVLTAVVIDLTTPQEEPEVFRFDDLICEDWSTADVREFHMDWSLPPESAGADAGREP